MLRREPLRESGRGIPLQQPLTRMLVKQLILQWGKKPTRICIAMETLRLAWWRLLGLGWKEKAENRRSQKERGESTSWDSSHWFLETLIALSGFPLIVTSFQKDYLFLGTVDSVQSFSILNSHISIPLSLCSFLFPYILGCGSDLSMLGPSRQAPFGGHLGRYRMFTRRSLHAGARVFVLESASPHQHVIINKH